MSDPEELETDFEKEGYQIFDPVFSLSEVSTWIELLDKNCEGEGVRRKSEVYAMRNLLQVVPELQSLVEDQHIRSIVEPILGPGYFVIRSLLFDKIPGANWKVRWHQDRTIAVRQRLETPGFGPWSTKAGLSHVHAPVSVLEKVLILRIHLDACGVDNGPLRVIPSSHRCGILTGDSVKQWRSTVEPVTCTALAGGILLIRPLLLHASSPAQTPAHRRVIHLEFTSENLPGGLEWHAESCCAPRSFCPGFVA